MSEFEIRPGRVDDEPAVAALSAHIWEGEDYVPRRFAQWLADEHGQFTVVYEGDQLVGFNKLTRIAVREWWLEGLRVHPEHRGRGIARLLHNYTVDLAKQNGSGYLRFATSGRNIAIHKLARKSGFQLVSTYLLAEVAVDPTITMQGRFVQASNNERVELRNWLQQSPHFASTGGLYEEHWKWLELLPRLKELVAEGRVYWWFAEADEQLGVVVQNPGEDGILWLNYVDSAGDTIAELSVSMRRFAATAGFEALKVKLAATDALRHAVEQGGWQIAPDFEMWVFELKLTR